MTARNTTVPGGGTRAPGRPGSARQAGAAPATRTARLQAIPATQGTRATPPAPVLAPRLDAATAKAAPGPRIRKTSSQRVRARRRARPLTAASSPRPLEGSGSTTMAAPSDAVPTLRRRTTLLLPTPKGAGLKVPGCGKRSVLVPLQRRAPPSLLRRLRLAASASSPRKTPRVETAP